VLVKTGDDVLVSVRRALRGTDLGRLKEQVEAQFRTLDETEKAMRGVMTKLEAGFLRRFASMST